MITDLIYDFTMYKYIFCIYTLCFIFAQCKNDNGEFDLTLTQHKMCRAPKRINCADTRAIRIGKTEVKYDTDIKENMTAVKAKIDGTLNNKEVLKLYAKDVCENMVLKPMFMVAFNLGYCGVVKGHYSITVDMSALLRRSFAGKFMYGNWTVKTLLYNNHCSLHCEVMEFSVTPK